MAGYTLNLMNQPDADRYCQLGGRSEGRELRLPTKEEFQQLAKYLGEGTAQGYSAKSSAGVEILPGLSDYFFWSSSVLPSNSHYVYAFFRGGVMQYSNGSDFAVRCVLRR